MNDSYEWVLWLAALVAVVAVILRDHRKDIEAQLQAERTRRAGDKLQEVIDAAAARARELQVRK
jgi:hypothetical protein